MEKLWNRNYNSVMAASTLFYFAFYLLSPLLPLYLTQRFGAGKDTIGIVLSGYTIAALLIRPFSGFVVDCFSRKKVMVTCLAVFSVFFLGYVAAGTLLMFAIVRTLHGAPFGATTVANSTVAIDVLPSSRRNEGIGFYGLSGNLGMAIAPSVGIWIYHLTDNFQLLFWLAFLMSLLGLFFASQVKVKTKKMEKRRTLSLDRFFLTRAWLLAINIAFFGFCFGVMSNYLAIYSKEMLNITGGTGTYFMLLSLGLILSRFQGAKGLRQGLITHNCSEGIVISLIGYTLFVAVPTFSSNMTLIQTAYYLSAILIGLGNGHMYPAFLNMFIQTARHDQRGTANSSILTAWDSGFGLGILIGGITAELASYNMAFWVVAAVNATGVILFFAATRQFFERRRLNITPSQPEAES